MRVRASIVRTSTITESRSLSLAYCSPVVMAEARGLELCLGIGVCAVAVLVRLAVSLHPYSGE